MHNNGRRREGEIEDENQTDEQARGRRRSGQRGRDSRCRNFPSAPSPAGCLWTFAAWRPGRSFRWTACWAWAARCRAAVVRSGS